MTKNNEPKQSIERIDAPRSYEEASREQQLYCIEIEIYTVYRQIMELNVTNEQALDLVTVSLMKYNKHNAVAFREVLKEIVRKYSFYDVYSRALVRYFWTSGMGINKIMKLTRQSQYAVYKIAEKFVPLLKQGNLNTNLEPFAGTQFVEELDKLLFILSTFDGLHCRRADFKANKLDTFRSELSGHTKGEML